MKKVEVKIYIDRYGYEHVVIDGMDFQVRYKKWGTTRLWNFFDFLRDIIKRTQGWARMHWKEAEYEFVTEMKVDDLLEKIKETGTKYYKMIERKLKEGAVA